MVSRREEVARFPPSWLAYAGLLCVLLVALYARFPQFPAPSLWLDEAWRAYLIIAHESWQESIAQSAREHLFLLPSEWICGKVGVWFFGKTELAFRIWPLLFALLGILGVYCFVAQVSTRRAAVLAALLIAIGPDFIRYAREFKPYALDLALSAWVLYAAVRVPSQQRTWSDWCLFLLLVAFALSSLVFGFLFPAVVAYRFRLSRPRTWFDFALLLVPLGFFAATWVFFLKPQQVAGVQQFWADYFLSGSERIPFVAREATRFLQQTFVFGWPLAVCGYVVSLPVMSLYRRDGVWLLLLTPFFIQVLAAMLGLYPLFHRPSYYLYGLVVMAFAYVVGALTLMGTTGKGPWHGRLELGVVGVALGYLIYAGALTEGLRQARMWPTDQGHAIFARLAQEFRSGDKLLVSAATYFPLLFYQDEMVAANPALRPQLPARRQTLSDRSPTALCQSFLKHSVHIHRGDRMWFLTSHVHNAYQHYVRVFSPLGLVKVLVKSPRQSLIMLEVQVPATQVVCS